MPKFIVRARKPDEGISTSGAQVDALFDWLKDEVHRTQFGSVGLMFHIHQGKVTRIEKTVSVMGKFELRVEGS